MGLTFWKNLLKERAQETLTGSRWDVLGGDPLGTGGPGLGDAGPGFILALLLSHCCVGCVPPQGAAERSGDYWEGGPGGGDRQVGLLHDAGTGSRPGSCHPPQRASSELCQSHEEGSPAAGLGKPNSALDGGVRIPGVRPGTSPHRPAPLQGPQLWKRSAFLVPGFRWGSFWGRKLGTRCSHALGSAAADGWWEPGVGWVTQSLGSVWRAGSF